MKKTQLFKNISVLFLEEKNIYPELCKIRGINRSTLASILFSLSIDSNRKISTLSQEERKLIEAKINQYTIDTSLRKKILEDIEREKAIVSNRGFRHENQLKLRGQRTKSTGRKKKKARVK